MARASGPSLKDLVAAVMLDLVTSRLDGLRLTVFIGVAFSWVCPRQKAVKHLLTLVVARNKWLDVLRPM